MKQKNLADLYKLPAIPWSRVVEALESDNQRNDTCFIATTRPNGRPHLTGVGAVWDNGKVYVVSAGASTTDAAPERIRDTGSHAQSLAWNVA